MSPQKEPERGDRSSKFPSKDQFLFLPRLFTPGERRAFATAVIIAILALIAIPVSAYYHATKPIADYGGTWTEALVGAPLHINPLLVQGNDTDSDLANLIYSGLLRHDGSGNLIGDLAESYAISDDGLQYTFTLRENLKWHDGKEISADDVAFTILTAQNGEYGSVHRSAWQGVDVVKKDSRVITFKLKNKYAQFLQNATIGILPKNIWESVRPANFGLFEKNLKPIGSGPYVFSKLNRTKDGTIESYELVAFDGYALGKPFIKKIVFKFYDCESDAECAQSAVGAYNNGDADGIASISPRNIKLLRLKGQLMMLPIKIPRYFAVFFNQAQSKALADKSVRTALNYATDKKTLLENALESRGTAVDSPVLPGILPIANPKETYEFNLDKAKGVLEKVPPSLELTASMNVPELAKIAELLKSQWETAGARVTIKSLSVADIHKAIKDRSYDALLFGEGFFVDPDPFDFWHSSQKKDPGKNIALYENKEADRLLEEARQTIDRTSRYSLYDKFQNIIIKDAPAVFLYSPEYTYVQPKKIRGNDTTLISSPSNRFDTVHQWYIDTKRGKR